MFWVFEDDLPEGVGGERFGLQIGQVEKGLMKAPATLYATGSQELFPGINLIVQSISVKQFAFSPAGFSYDISWPVFYFFINF